MPSPGSQVGAAHITLAADNQVGSALRQAENQMKSTLGRMQAIGSSLTVGVTAPLVAMGGAALKASSDLDSALKEAGAAADLTAQEMDKVGEASERIAVETGENIEGIVDAFKFALSNGQDLADAQELVRKSTQASAAGFGEQEEIVRSATTAMSAFGDEVDGFPQLLNKITAAAQNAEVEIPAFGDAIKRVSNSADFLGVSLEEALGVIGTVSDRMGDANRAGRAVSRMFQEIKNPASEAGEVISQNFAGGVDAFLQSIKQQGFTATLIELAKRLKENDQNIGQVIRSSNTLSAAFAVLSDDGQKVADIMNSAQNAGGTVAEAFNASETMVRKANQTWNQFMATLRPFGDVLSDNVGSALDSVKSTLRGLEGLFESMTPKLRQNIIMWSGIAAAVGPALLAVSGFVAIVSPLIGLVGSAGIALGLMAAAALDLEEPMNVLTAAVWGYVSAQAAATLLTGSWVSIGLLAVGALAYLIGGLENGQTGFKDLGNAIENTFDGFRTLIDYIKTTVNWLSYINTMGGVMPGGSVIPPEDGRGGESQKEKQEKASDRKEKADEDDAIDSMGEALNKFWDDGVSSFADEVGKSEGTKDGEEQPVSEQLMGSIKDGLKGKDSPFADLASKMPGRPDDGPDPAETPDQVASRIEERLEGMEQISSTEREELTEKAKEITEQLKAQRKAGQLAGQKPDESLTNAVAGKLEGDISKAMTKADFSPDQLKPDAARPSSSAAGSSQRGKLSPEGKREITVTINLDGEQIAEKVVELQPGTTRRFDDRGIQ